VMLTVTSILLWILDRIRKVDSRRRSKRQPDARRIAPRRQDTKLHH
jgi:hypothetical protein